MIDWKKIDKNNLPEHDKLYIVTNGKQAETAWLHKWQHNQEKEFGFPDMSIVETENMTHYAEINLPEE